MGSGKSSAAINYMKQHSDRRFMYITPYLSEIARVVAACPEAKLMEPGEYGGRTKSQDLEVLLKTKHSVATTHALFSAMKTETLELIRSGHYTLIMDEVMNVIEIDDMPKSDIDNYIHKGIFVRAEDGEHLLWGGIEDYSGHFTDTVNMAKRGNLIYYDDTLLFWTLPVANFEVFDEVFVLTYMFNAQIQRYYYDMHNLEYELIGVEKVDGEYRFCGEPAAPADSSDLINKIHILEDNKLNAIGVSDRYVNPVKDPTLSSSWYRRSTERGNPNYEYLRKHAVTVQKTRFKCTYDDLIWTTFEERRDRLEFTVNNKGKKVRCLPEHGFVACTTRATNEFRDRHNLIYPINYYPHPITSRYLKDHGAEMDQDAYSLSEFLQWLWRSAIRCGEDINVYIPSRRMRTLLQNWLQRLADGHPY